MPFTSTILRTAYACVFTSPALSSCASDIGPVATVMRAVPTSKVSMSTISIVVHEAVNFSTFFERSF